MKTSTTRKSRCTRCRLVVWLISDRWRDRNNMATCSDGEPHRGDDA